jgi:hypothetical protein
VNAKDGSSDAMFFYIVLCTRRCSKTGRTTVGQYQLGGGAPGKCW